MLLLRVIFSPLRRFSLVILLFAVAACGHKNTATDAGTTLARAYDEYLYEDEVNGMLPRNMTAADSEGVVTNYIDNWIRNKVLAHKAEANLNETEKGVQKQLDEYRNSLLTHKYQMKLVSERLDTNITEEQMRAYYEKNRNNFELRKNVVQLSFVKIAEDNVAAPTVRSLFRSSRTADKARLAGLCAKHANNFFLDDEVWLDFDEILKELPIKNYDQEHFLRNNKFLEVKEGNYIYLINIRAYRIKNSVAALEFEKDNIRNILLNQRKLELLKEMEVGVLREAEVNG